jgi:hypothetical protein
MRNSFLKAFYKVNPSLDPANQTDDKPADNNEESSVREAMADFKAGFDAMKQELAETRAELSKYINQQQPADNVDNSNNVDNNEGGADNAS